MPQLALSACLNQWQRRPRIVLNLTCVLSSAINESVIAGPSSLAYASLSKLTCISVVGSFEVMSSNFSVVRAYNQTLLLWHNCKSNERRIYLDIAKAPGVASKSSLIVNPSSADVRPLYFLSHVRCLSLEKCKERAVLH